MRFKGTVAYDGTAFHGWQSQVGGNTIQDILQKRLSEILRTPTSIQGSGRTDSGVHAKAQVFHFDAQWKHPMGNLIRAIMTGLPPGIQVTKLQHAPEQFHARFDAVGKRYIYRLYEGYASPFECRFCTSLGHWRLNLDAMRDAATILIGKKDFTAFSAKRGDGSEDWPIKDLKRLDIVKRGPRYTITAEADGFLYKMVRSLAGTLIDVGRGRLKLSQVQEILDSKVRTALIVTAPARGLTLEKVFYPPTGSSPSVFSPSQIQSIEEIV